MASNSPTHTAGGLYLYEFHKLRSSTPILEAALCGWPLMLLMEHCPVEGSRLFDDRSGRQSALTGPTAKERRVLFWSDVQVE